MSSKPFNDYGKYYNLLYKDKDYRAESDYVRSTLKKYRPELSDVVELGMGTGNHAVYLNGDGIRIVGIERSEEMAAQARSRGLECFVSDIAEFSVDQKFDAAISLFHVISYLTGSAALIKTFRNVAGHLRPGGIFLFDCWYTPAVFTQKPETRVKRLEDSTVKLIRIAEPVIHVNENIVDVHYDIILEKTGTRETSTITETHRMRHFSLPEIELLAELTGFDLLGSEEFLTGNTPSENTWGVCCILRKKQ